MNAFQVAPRPIVRQKPITRSGMRPAWERMHGLNLPRIRERLRAEYERRAA